MNIGTNPHIRSSSQKGVKNGLVSRMRCSAKRCTADPGALQTQEFVTVPGLQRTTTLRFVLRCARETQLFQRYAPKPLARE
jgi:hypothetical protein